MSQTQRATSARDASLFKINASLIPWKNTYSFQMKHHYKVGQNVKAPEWIKLL